MTLHLVTEERLKQLRAAAVLSGNFDVHSVSDVQFTNEELIELIDTIFDLWDGVYSEFDEESL